MSNNMKEEIFWEKFHEKLSLDRWQHIDYYVLQSYLRSGQNIIIIDVSSDDNHKHYNHTQIKYINSPLFEIIGQLDQFEIYKGSSIICVCAGGPKSAVAAQILRFKGIDASFLSGGTEAVIQITKTN